MQITSLYQLLTSSYTFPLLSEKRHMKIPSELKSALQDYQGDHLPMYAYFTGSHTVPGTFHNLLY